MQFSKQHHYFYNFIINLFFFVELRSSLVAKTDSLVNIYVEEKLRISEMRTRFPHYVNDGYVFSSLVTLSLVSYTFCSIASCLVLTMAHYLIWHNHCSKITKHWQNLNAGPIVCGSSQP